MCFLTSYSVFNEHMECEPFLECVPFLECSPFLAAAAESLPLWWAQVESNHRPRAYQARALTI